jgi:hypothetical protein
MKPEDIVKEFIKSKYQLDPNKELVIAGLRGIEISQSIKYNDNKIDDWNDTILFLAPTETKVFRGTVDPGLEFMKQPINTDGTGRLEPGVLWLKRGLHRGYEALVQARPALVRRDGNKDFKFDEKDKTQKGHFGANLHGASSLSRVGRSSAMCVVVALLHTSKGFKDLIKWCYSFGQREYPCVIIEQRELSLFMGGMK